MPQARRKSLDDSFRNEVTRLHDEERKNPYQIASILGCSEATARRIIQGGRVKGKPSAPPSEPDPLAQFMPTVHQSLPDGSPKTTLQRIEYLGEPGAPGGLPEIAMQSEGDDLKARVSVLEAFFATIQQHPAYARGSPLQFTNGAPSGEPSAPVSTHKRGFVMADDVWEAIHSYAGAHHRQISEVVDQALRECFAHQGWPGQEVRRDG